MLAGMGFHEKGQMKFGTKQGLHVAVLGLCQKHVGNCIRVQDTLMILRSLSSMLSNGLGVYELMLEPRKWGSS